MTTKEYEAFAQRTAMYPDAEKGTIQGLAYVALGLAGEAGEFSNKAKKLIRDGISDELIHGLRDELGDVMWYLARAARELGVSLDEIMALNCAKLKDRFDRGKIGGSGDKR